MKTTFYILAIILLASCQDNKPKINELAGKALRLYKENKFKESISAANEALALKPEFPADAILYKVRAKSKIEIGDKDGACEDLDSSTIFDLNDQAHSEARQLIAKHCK